MSILEDLRDIYNQEAETYTHTRKKPWREASIVFPYIEKYFDASHKKPIHILELGCGSGRFLEQESLKKMNINYTGVDISSDLMSHAKLTHPKWRFICEDMLQFLTKQEAETQDIIVTFASFQHLPTRENRIAVLQEAYRVLKYGGMMIMTNRARSKHFRKTYHQAIWKARRKHIASIWRSELRDVYIPRKWKQKSHLRYYHMFDTKELSNLCGHAGFAVQAVGYVDSNDLVQTCPPQNTNSIIVLRKTIFDQEST